MYVRDYMTTDVITVSSNTLVQDALKIMEQHSVSRLPVVDKGKLVGVVTKNRLREVEPSPRAEVTVWQLKYLLSKIRVGQVMRKEMITVSPDTTLEDAVMLAQRQGVGLLPVIEDGKLVGVLTMPHAVRILAEASGIGQPGSRLHLFDSCKGKPFGEVLDIVNKHRVKLRAMFTMVAPGTKRKDLILHLETLNPTPIVEELKARGYTVEARVRPEPA